MYKGHNELGEHGEKLACKFLTKQGYKLIEKNYSCKIGEIDLIFKDGDTIVFIEVKTRSSTFFGLPREAVDSHKQNKIKQIATLYMMKKNCYPAKCRCDVIEIMGENITHIKNAF